VIDPLYNCKLITIHRLLITGHDLQRPDNGGVSGASY
jgi:hypothetical protein